MEKFVRVEIMQFLLKITLKKKLGVFHESIKLTSYFGEDLEAFICENCKKIIINLE